METFYASLKRNKYELRQKTAIKYGKHSVTYGELVEYAENIAAYWNNIGLNIGDKIVIISRKNIETVQLIVSSLMYGACYVPIDWRNPAKRIQKMIVDCQPKIIVGTSNDIDNLRPDDDFTTDARLLSFEELSEQSLKYQDITIDNILSVAHSNTGELPAYCLFTSGSTGTPKGVQISYTALEHFLLVMNERLEIDSKSVCLNTSPFFFDVSIADTVLPLYFGATVNITSDILSPPAVIQIIKSEEVTHFCAVSSILSLIGKELSEHDQITSLRTIMSGAEILDPATISRIFKASPQVKIINGYGPTEATCVCLAKQFTHSNINEETNEFSIGRPLRGMMAALLNDKGISHTGIDAGELLITGPQLMLGYLNDEETTSKKLWTDGEQQFYRTGDYCRRDENNEYYFIGRIDDEVKVAGYRFHLNEVTKCLKLCHGVDDVAVVVLSDDTRKTLVAVLVIKEVTDSDVLSAVKIQVSKMLPSYMIPTQWNLLQALPRTATGKINKTELISMLEKSVSQ